MCASTENSRREPLEPDPDNAGGGKPHWRVRRAPILKLLADSGGSGRLISESVNTIQITLNGDVQAVPSDSALTSLIEGLKLRKGRVAVEINRVIIPKAAWPDIKLRPGDVVEIVNFVGGG